MKKKLLAFFLLIFLLLTSCSGVTDAITSALESSTESPQETTTPSEDITDTPSPAQIRAQQLDALYGEEISRLNAERTLFSEGYTVTSSREAIGDIALLTDGQELINGTAEGAVQFAGKDELVLTLDLGSVKTGIGDIGFGMLYALDLKANLPNAVEFFVSDDGENFLLVGTVYRPFNRINNSRNVIELRLQNQISARYIKAVISAEDILSNNLYIDEMYVYSYLGEKEKSDVAYDEYYKNPPMPQVTEDLYWESSDAHYNEETNLVVGKSYRIKSALRIDSSLQTDYYNSPVTNKALTDGVIGNSNVSNPAYFHFTRAAERTVFFDLEKVSGVSSVTISFLCNPGTSVALPEKVTVMGSMDSHEWTELAVCAPKTEQTGYHRVEFTIPFEKTATRFIAVDIIVNVHVWVDEISVTGTKSTEDAAKLDIKTDTKTEEYLSSDALGGVENIILMYTFKNENPSIGLNTVEELLPYVAYHNNEGKITDTFFDSFLFLPCGTTCPSGGHLYYDAQKPSRASDWLLFEEDLFDKGANMPALSEAVDIMDEALGTDTEMSVFLSIFSTVYGDTDFGDIEGEINGVNFNNIEDRKKVIAWWIDRMVEKMESGNYDNLRLDGFYWYHECMESRDPHEVELVKFTADYVHSLGYYFIWIPYYQSNGFNNWKNYGFDAAVMQPNYMFKDNVPESRLYDNANHTKFLGMGVEIEADFGIVSNFAKREKYRDYLRVGIEMGYMNSIKMYYQDGGPGVLYRAYQSVDPYYHSVYDDTYRYAKGTLTYDSLMLKKTNYTGEQNDELVAIYPKMHDETLLDVSVVANPKYGTVRHFSDGSIYYYPDEGFVGTDTFVIRDANSTTAPDIVITVVIEAAANE